jgi:hypothetical protein
MPRSFLEALGGVAAYTFLGSSVRQVSPHWTAAKPMRNLRVNAEETGISDCMFQFLSPQ